MTMKRLLRGAGLSLAFTAMGLASAAMVNAGSGGDWMPQGVGEAEICETRPDDEACGPVGPLLFAPRIVAAPPPSTESPSADFKFEADEIETLPAPGFRCRLDGAAFETCDGGVKNYTGLGVGRHTFRVKTSYPDLQGPEAVFSWRITAKVIPPPGIPRFGLLIVKPEKRVVRAGKRTIFQVTLRNIGNVDAAGTRVCATVPRKFVQTKGCLRIGLLKTGVTAVKKFRLRIKKSARRNKGEKGPERVLALNFTAYGQGAVSSKARTRIVVR